MEDKIKLFSEAFGDSKDTARDFFFCDDVITVTEYVGKWLAAMASLVPIYAENSMCCSLEQMAVLRRNNRGYYIYGVCVDKKYRGMGLFRSVMIKAEEDAKRRGADFVCLIPADEGLADTYRRMGYEIEVQPEDDDFQIRKKIFLESDSFRKFARSSENCDVKERMYGLMKVLNKNLFSPEDREFAFGDSMGDI